MGRARVHRWDRDNVVFVGRREERLRQRIFCYFNVRALWRLDARGLASAAGAVLARAAEEPVLDSKRGLCS